MNQPIIEFHLADKNAKLPSYETTGSAGMDISAILNSNLEPGNREMIRTGLHCAIPVGWQLEVRPRSGLAFRHGISIVNSPGTIDSDYRGEICVILINHSSADFKIEAGDRIAQLVVMPAVQAGMVIAKDFDDLSKTERGEGGFGHTGK